MERLPAAQRTGLAARVLVFLERCPACDTALDVEEEVTDDTVSVTLDCPTCDATLFAGTRDHGAEQPDTN